MLLNLLDLMKEPFIIRALLSAIVLAICGGVMGSFIQMRGMSFYADTIAHSAFAGVALGILLGTNLSFSAVAFAIIMGISVLEIRKRTKLSFDTILGVVFATVASLGIFLLTFLENVRVDLLGLLFGDILALDNLDVILIFIAASISLTVIWFIHKDLILEIVHPDLARVEGVPIERNDILFGIVVASMIALGIKLIGIILLAGLFLIPSAISYLVAKSLKELLLGSVLMGMVVVMAGIVLSVLIDSATGPTIVLLASFLFIATLSAKSFLRSK